MIWDDVADALQRAVVRASGLPDDHVVWKDQDYTAPSVDYATLRITSFIPLGIDYVSTSQDLTRIRGQEIELRARGRREVPLELEFFTAANISGRSGAALALASRALASMVLPSVRQIFRLAEVGLFDVGTAQWIPDVPSTHFRGRAIAVVRLYMPPPTVAEYTGYIERVSGTATMRGSNGDVTLPFDTGDPDA